MTNTGFYGSSIVNPEWWKPIIQDYLNNMLIGYDICNTKCEKYLSSGRAVHFPQISDVRVQDYTPGTDLTIDPLTAVDSTLTVDQSKAATFSVDPVEVKQALAEWVPRVSYQSAFELKNNTDQKIIQTGIDGASTTASGGSLSTSSVLEAFNARHAQLFRNNATDDELFAVIDADRLSLLTQTFVANGFQEADISLRRQFAGRASQFNVYVTNNLPYSVTLTVDTQPTNLDTFTLLGVTWTCVTDGTATNPGDVNIGADLADFQAIFPTAVNGTTPPSVGDYADVSTNNRRILQNAQLSASAFAANVSTITAYGKITPSETFTAGTNVFGTETTTLLFGRMGAISLGIQMTPELYIKPLQAQLGDNYITHTLFGTKVFSRDAKRLTNLTINA